MLHLLAMRGLRAGAQLAGIEVACLSHGADEARAAIDRLGALATFGLDGG